jgi:hypothetical protein
MIFHLPASCKESIKEFLEICDANEETNKTVSEFRQLLSKIRQNTYRETTTSNSLCTTALTNTRCSSSEETMDFCQADLPKLETADQTIVQD